MTEVAVHPLWLYDPHGRGLVFRDPQTANAVGWPVRLLEQRGWKPQGGSMELELRKCLPHAQVRGSSIAHAPPPPVHPLLARAGRR